MWHKDGNSVLVYDYVDDFIFGGNSNEIILWHHSTHCTLIYTVRTILYNTYCALDRVRREFQQLGTLQSPDACRQAPRVSTRAQDAIPDPQRTQVVTEYLFKIFLDFSKQDWFFPLGY